MAGKSPALEQSAVFFVSYKDNGINFGFRRTVSVLRKRNSPGRNYRQRGQFCAEGTEKEDTTVHMVRMVHMDGTGIRKRK